MDRRKHTSHYYHLDNLILHLIRHGRTEDTVNKRYCGSTDTPLNNEGKEQILNLKSKNYCPDVDVVFSSKYTRAKQTAEILFNGHEIIFTENLCEYDFGLWEQMVFDDILKVRYFPPNNYIKFYFKNYQSESIRAAYFEEADSNKLISIFRKKGLKLDIKYKL